MLPSRFLSSTPAVKYSQRKNNGSVVCTLNERGIPSCSTRGGSDVAIGFQDSEAALKSPYQYMFQKVSDKALGWSGCRWQPVEGGLGNGVMKSQPHFSFPG